MEQDKIENAIEAILFYKGEPVKVSFLVDTLKTSEDVVHEALASLSTSLQSRGLRLVREGKYAALATAPEVKEIIETLRREELEGPLGRAGLETLAIIIYQAPVSRADIEYVRGVNSSQILRSLTMRGLVERIENPRDKRSYLYQPTPELPATLGVSSLKDMPEFDEMKQQIRTVIEHREEELKKEQEEYE